MRLSDRRASDRASVLMLMPAGVLIVLMLAAIAVDLSLVFLRQRQASALAADIANDLATAALDVEGLRQGGTFELDPTRARRLGEELAESSDLADELVGVDVTVIDATTVTVTIRAAVDYLYTSIIPGASDSTEVQATATATASDGT
jgi:hypothetical protein